MAVVISGRRYDLKVPQKSAVLGNVINLPLGKPVQSQRFFLSVLQDFQFLFGVLSFQQSFLRDSSGFRGF